MMGTMGGSANQMLIQLQKVSGNGHTKGSTIQYMRIDQGVFHISVAQYFLDRSNTLHQG